MKTRLFFLGKPREKWDMRKKMGIDYSTFGQTQPGRNGGTKYRYGFNGQEKDDEVTGNSGATYTADYWEYDARLGRRWNLDPKPSAFASNYSCFANNPFLYTDPEGDTIRVSTVAGKFLFDLNDGQTVLTTMTAKQVYDKGYQWFEPLADNYMPIIKMGADIGTMEGIKHFTWEQIKEFAMEDRSMYSYFQKGSGDWKVSKEGADGHFLVTVDGQPYWADAIGQIPFAVDYFSDIIKDNNINEAVQKTVTKGKEYGSGTLFGAADNSNTYDNYFILRGAMWAAKKYVYSPTNDEVVQTGASPSSMARPITLVEKEKFLKR